ncbi:MAG: hypothetical protein AABY40_02570 [Nanoarchaeota archaeon]
MHKTPLQSGALAWFTASVGWQHWAGTQSASTEHRSAAGTQEITTKKIGSNMPIINLFFISIPLIILN